MTNEPVIKKIVREVVREELGPVKKEILGELDGKFNLFSEQLQKFFDEFRSDMVSLKDEIVGELKTNREEQTMLNGRTVTINKIEDRVEKLEKIHPRGTHPFVAA